MSGAKSAKKKQSLWQTLRAASGPYRRLLGYVKPYKVRFIVGLVLGFAYGGVSALLPLAISRVTGTIFHGAAPNPTTLGSNLGALDTGPKINSIVLICLAIPAIMTVRSLCSYGNTYCMQWVSNKVVTDIRGQLFNKMVRLSMDFFNRMRSGLLISRITNETRVVQMALTAVSSDIFKQPVLIVGAISVLFLMDWKFTLITLVLFPTCLLPLRIYGRRARKALRGQFEGMGEDRKSTRLNSSHLVISYAVFCLKKKNNLPATARWPLRPRVRPTLSLSRLSASPHLRCCRRAPAHPTPLAFSPTRPIPSCRLRRGPERIEASDHAESTLPGCHYQGR